MSAGGTFALFRLKGHFAGVLVDDDVPADWEALAGALADLLGREEWCEYLVLNALGDAGTGIGNTDFSPLAVLARGDGDVALFTIYLAIADGVCRVDDQIEQNLIHFTR